MKFCRDCRYYRSDAKGCVGEPIDRSRPYDDVHFMVTGTARQPTPEAERGFVHFSALTNRSDPKKCGVQAKWFAVRTQ